MRQRQGLNTMIFTSKGLIARATKSFIVGLAMRQVLPAATATRLIQKLGVAHA
jgi:hypothetical protein